MEGSAGAPAAYALIVVNIAVSLYAFLVDRNFINQFAFQVRAVAEEKQNYRLVTSSFLHANGPHLLLNMLTIWFFGPPVEALLGTLGFLVVYFGAILVSGVVSLRVNRDNPAYSSVGASDAASGIVLSYCCFYPFEPIYILFVPFGVPAILYGALFILVSSRLMARQDRVIAHEGHLGGALGGAFLTVLMRPDVVTQFFA